MNNKVRKFSRKKVVIITGCLMLLYLGAVGPEYWLTRRGFFPQWLFTAINYPLLILARESDTFGECFDFYLYQWDPVSRYTGPR